MRRPRDFGAIPTPPDIAEAPERAVLAVLEVALETTAHALFAEWPELTAQEQDLCAHAGPTEPDRLPRCQAATIIDQAKRLGDTVRRYRAGLEDFLRRKAETDHSEDVPF